MLQAAHKYGQENRATSSYPIGSMYAIYGNIYHQYNTNVSIYTSTMDPMGMIFHHIWTNEIHVSKFVYVHQSNLPLGTIVTLLTKLASGSLTKLLKPSP